VGEGAAAGTRCRWTNAFAPLATNPPPHPARPCHATPCSTLSEKVEDRNAELARLRKKATIAVQVLTHVREKLHFVTAEAARLDAELATIDGDVSVLRGELAEGKKERERARVENEKAKTAQGFAHNDTLAIDFERRKRDVVRLQSQIAEAQRRYRALAAVAGMSLSASTILLSGGAGVR